VRRHSRLPDRVWPTSGYLLELFAGVSDGRAGRGRDHPVAAVLALAAAAVPPRAARLHSRPDHPPTRGRPGADPILDRPGRNTGRPGRCLSCPAVRGPWPQVSQLAR
jgi:hypothetical protein